MPNDGFNGSTLSFGGVVQGKIKSIGFNENGNPVDLTGSTDAVHKYLTGIPDVEAVLEVHGTTTTAIGTTGALTVNWFTGKSSTSSGNWVLVSRDESGQLDSDISTKLTFKPSAV